MLSKVQPATRKWELYGQEEEEAELRAGLAKVRLHQGRLQQIYSTLGEERPAQRVKLLMEGQEEVKEQLEGLRQTLGGLAGGDEQDAGSCSYCRVPINSDRSR